MKRSLITICHILFVVAKVLFCSICIALSFALVSTLILVGNEPASVTYAPSNYEVGERYDKYITNSFSDALNGIMSIEKVYWLSDDDLIAPEPDPSCYGSTSDPSQLQPVLDKAEKLIDGQQLVFSCDTEILSGSQINYYYDPTLLAITWKIPMDNSVYTISEIKIADPSQFRRFLSDGEYASGKKYLTSEMAASVNAVVAVNGDYYAMRQMGTIIYNGQIMRMEGTSMDSCYIDANGDLQFVRLGEITDQAEMQKRINDEGIRFNLSFGPILVENGQLVELREHYCVGEAGGLNARAALCQKGELHYLIVMASPEPPYDQGQLLSNFAQRVFELGVDKAYNLDGGRSGALIMNDQLINYVFERRISDIIYFATAISNGE